MDPCGNFLFFDCQWTIILISLLLSLFKRQFFSLYWNRQTVLQLVQQSKIFRIRSAIPVDINI